MVEMTDVIYNIILMKGMDILKDPDRLNSCISDLTPAELDQKAKILSANLNAQICELLFHGAMENESRLKENIGKAELILQNDRGMSRENACWMTDAFYRAVCKIRGYQTENSSEQEETKDTPQPVTPSPSDSSEQEEIKDTPQPVTPSPSDPSEQEEMKDVPKPTTLYIPKTSEIFLWVFILIAGVGIIILLGFVAPQIFGPVLGIFGVVYLIVAIVKKIFK